MARLEPEARHNSEIEREYRVEQIEVTWEPERCIHVGHCIRGIPSVFKPEERPWITLENGTPDRIAEVIRRCPTGALRYRRLDGEPQEEPEPHVTIRAMPDGPLYVRGQVHLYARDRGLDHEETRVALCRCGHSRNKPFCDNSHMAVEFRSSD